MRPAMELTKPPTIADYDETAPRPLPRVWPAVAIVAAFWAWRGYLAVANLSLFHIFVGLMAGTAVLTLSFLLWWSIDRRGRRGERLVPVVAFFALAVVAGVISRDTLGPMTVFMAGVPWVITAWA